MQPGTVRVKVPWPQKMKAVVAAVAELAGTIGTAIADGHIEQAEGVAIVVAFVVAYNLVFHTKNQPATTRR